MLTNEPRLAICMIKVVRPVCSCISGKKSFVSVNPDEDVDCGVKAKFPTRWCQQISLGLAGCMHVKPAAGL